MIPNNHVIKRHPSIIGTDEDALYCMTDDTTCCRTPPCLPDNGGSGNERGHWYLPKDDCVGYELSGIERDGVWYASWLTGAVLLNYRGDGTDDHRAKSGLFRCRIEDKTNTAHDLYTCIYTEQSHTSECKVHYFSHSPMYNVIS